MPQCRLEQVAETILEECGEAYYVQLAVDIAPMADGNMTVFSHATASRGYTPDELQAVCESVGLIDFQWATEGMITGATMPDPPKPIYQGYVGQHLKVWEFLAFKPDDTLTERIEPDWFRNNTRDAARLPYLAMARMPILTNVDAATVPRGWVQEAQRRARAAGGERLIDSLANKLCAGIENDEGRIEAIVRFVQDVLIHHPLVQPLEFNGAAVTDPATLLFLGIGRCGAAAPLAAALCNAAGLEARVERVPGHVFAVAKASGVEVLVEADFFKKGVILREADGHLLRYATLLENPRLTDSQPDAGVWWTIHLRNTTDIWGRNSFGYLRDDFLLYSSYFDGAAKRRYKPKIPVVSAERSSAGVRMSWSDATPVDGAEVEYRVAARVASRGWNYHTEPDDIAPILSPPPAYRERWTDETSIEIDASEGSYFEVTPRLRARPDVFCWPSEEILLSTSTDQREW